MVDCAIYSFYLDYEKTQHLAVGEVVSSGNFSTGDYLWRINCYPRGDKIDCNNEHLSIYLQLVSKSKNVKAHFEAMVVSCDGSCSGECRYVHFHLSDEDGIKWGWSQFMKRSDLLPYVMNGMVTISCAVSILADKNMPVVPPSDLATHLGHLLDCNLGTDVSFIVGGETVPAHHRAVLAARSPVFRAELFGSMGDATMPSITLQDIDPAAFKVMLKFIYTDAFPLQDELGDSPVDMMLHLLAAADRFALDRLKVMCELKLWKNISVDTAASVLACAETYSCPKLKAKCMEFFAVKENFKKAALTDGFIMLLQKFPALADELLGRTLGV